MKKQTIIYICILITIIILIVSLTFKICKSLTNKSSLAEYEGIPVSKVDISNIPESVIGYLSLPTLGQDYYINMPIKESTELNVLATSIGHFVRDAICKWECLSCCS